MKSIHSRTQDAVLNVETFIDLLERPDEVEVDGVVRLVDRLKPRQRVADDSDRNNVHVDPRQPVEGSDDNNNEADNVGDSREEVDDADIEEADAGGGGGGRATIPVLVFSCNRVTVSKALDLLISYRPSREQFPIIVTQDCGHAETR